MQGRIIKAISNDYTVLYDNEKYLCKGRGKLKFDKIKPRVGDIVEFSQENIILSILPRKNELIRPVISNVDQAYIITSLKHPDLDLNLLDKLLVMIEFNNITPIICFTKYDLLYSYEKKEFDSIKKYYQKIGYLVFMNTELDNIKKTFANKISVFTGQTGAGKSTLLNKLDKNLRLETNEISMALNRGKNTTTHVELLNLCNGWVADSPGFSDVFIDMTKEQIRDNMIEFENYKELCKYRDCMHQQETDCEIKRQVEKGNIQKSRYENYLKFISR
jgi:ribosome biogenesis GTPase